MQTFQVLIIGSGFGGQCAAVNLLKAGITDFRLLERRDFFGGTWCQNTYPGAAVDVPSPLYSLSFAPYRWTQMFAEQAELHRYTRYVVEHFGLRDRVELQANVEHVEWDDESKRWAVHTAGKGTFYAQFLINATGPLSQPVVPRLRGPGTLSGQDFSHQQLGSHLRLPPKTRGHRRQWRQCGPGDSGDCPGCRAPARIPAHAALGIAPG